MMVLAVVAARLHVLQDSSGVFCDNLLRLVLCFCRQSESVLYKQSLKVLVHLHNSLRHQLELRWKQQSLT